MLEGPLNFSQPVRSMREFVHVLSAGAWLPQNRDFQAQAFQCYRSERAFPNPNPRQIEVGIADLTGKLRRGVDLKKDVLPSRGRFLLTWMALLDQHKLDIDKAVFPVIGAREFVSEVIDVSDSKKRQLTVLEQFEIAMRYGENQFLRSLLLAHSGSRAIARGSDSRAGFSFTLRDLQKWEHCIGYFPYSLDGYGDPAGDTYHFWGQIIAGILATRTKNIADHFWKPVYSLLFPNTSFFVKTFRKPEHNAPSDIFYHQVIDRVGFDIGKKLGILT